MLTKLSSVSIALAEEMSYQSAPLICMWRDYASILSLHLKHKISIGLEIVKSFEPLQHYIPPLRLLRSHLFTSKSVATRFCWSFLLVEGDG